MQRRANLWESWAVWGKMTILKTQNSVKHS